MPIEDGQRPYRLNHVNFTVPTDALAQARAFYCDVLGLVEIPRPDSLADRGGFWLNVGQDEIHIGVEDGFDRRTTKGHLAYQVADLAYWRERISAAGCEIKESIPLPGYDRFEFRDPFGNRVEIIQPI